MDFSDGPATLLSREVKIKSAYITRAFLYQNGGGGGNRISASVPNLPIFQGKFKKDSSSIVFG